jgi:hypothetical protein
MAATPKPIRKEAKKFASETRKFHSTKSHLTKQESKKSAEKGAKFHAEHKKKAPRTKALMTKKEKIAAGLF